MSISAFAAAIVLSPLDDLIVLGLLGCLAKSRPSTTSSAGVVERMVSQQFSGDTEMAAKQTVATPVETSSDDLERVMAMLVAARGTKKPSVSIIEFLTDKAADSGRALSRIGAGFAAATENAALAFEAERTRQTRRTAQFLLAQAKS